MYDFGLKIQIITFPSTESKCDFLLVGLTSNSLVTYNLARNPYVFHEENLQLGIKTPRTGVASCFFVFVHKIND